MVTTATSTETFRAEYSRLRVAGLSAHDAAREAFRLLPEPPPPVDTDGDDAALTFRDIFSRLRAEGMSATAAARETYRRHPELRAAAEASHDARYRAGREVRVL